MHYSKKIGLNETPEKFRKEQMLMKRIILTTLQLSLVISLFSQTDKESIAQNDSTKQSGDDYIAKQGYNIAPLPEFMIDPFVGLYLGIYSTIFDYGDGKIYPNYYQSLTIAAAYGTKGKTNLGLEYLSYRKFMLSAKINHTKSTLYPFYGFNGYQTLYNEDFQTTGNDDYITSAFYNYQQTVNRIQVFIQDTIGQSFFNWQVGIDLGKYNTCRVDFDKLNKGVDAEDAAPDVPTLYDKYTEWGIISIDEKDGGWANSLRFAMVFDNRDQLTNPMHGMFSDVTLRYSPTFLGNTTSALQLSVTHRQFITLVDKKVSFAYRLRYDATFGKLPFYYRQVLADGKEGFGGTETLWGIHQNRIMANQFALGNFELRAKIVHFKFIQQNWHIAAVPLFHTGYLIQPIDWDLTEISSAERDKYFSNSNKHWYSSYGIGAKIVMNENTVIGADWAHSINNQAGNDAVYIGYAYSF